MMEKATGLTPNLSVNTNYQQSNANMGHLSYIVHDFNVASCTVDRIS